ncbi:hypothetical protein Tco_0062279 [Tanacetum coccineum]
MSSMGELTFFLRLKVQQREDGIFISQDKYVAEILKKLLMYITISRPDITFAVCACVRFQVTPKTSHLHAVKRIFRYLKGQPKLGIWYPKDSPFDLEAFSDSDYASLASLCSKGDRRHRLSPVSPTWTATKSCIQAGISDGTATGEFTFFTLNADVLIGTDCTKLVNLYDTPSPRDFPSEILNLQGQRHIF